MPKLKTGNTAVVKKGDLILIMELAKGVGRTEAAELAKVSTTTVHYRLQDPEFRQAVADQRRLFLDAAAGVLADASYGAAEVLWEIYSDEDEPTYVRRAAAKDVLEFSMRMREIMELEERIMALEFALMERVGE